MYLHDELYCSFRRDLLYIMSVPLSFFRGCNYMYHPGQAEGSDHSEIPLVYV